VAFAQLAGGEPADQEHGGSESKAKGNEEGKERNEDDSREGDDFAKDRTAGSYEVDILPTSAPARLAPRRLVDVTVKERRIKQSMETHWLVAGAKDGKISLWDVY
jgi:hypothetical protein